MTDLNRPLDPNQLAKSMIDIATGQQPSSVDSRSAAVAPEGEPTHAASIAPERRVEITKSDVGDTTVEETHPGDP